ncbi:MAG: MFS transporter [Acidobacteriaceae bacterium]|nr:MFS transporter [Acidobacteriaceae bacterium]
MSASRPRLFYGWWVVLTSALALVLGPIPIMVFSFGVFLRPLTQEFHAGRGAVSLAFTLHNTIAAFSLPFAGRLIDRFGTRRVIVPSILMVGLMLLSAYFCSGSLWKVYLFYLAVGVAGCGTAPVSYCALVSHWFDRCRGLALGVMMSGLGLGAFIMPSVSQALITRFGWRLTFGFAGVAILLITLPVVKTFLKDRPEPMGLLPDGVTHVFRTLSRPDIDLGLRWGEAWRGPTFWLLFCAFILVSASVQGCLTHIAAILADRGIPAQAAALATSMLGGGLLLGRTGSGYLLDRFFAPRVAAVIFGCAAAGIGLLRIASSQELAFTAATFIGLGLGAEVDIMAFLTSRYFGLRSFGAIYGVIFGGFGLAGGVGTYLMGAAFDSTGSYALPLALCCVLTVIGAALMLCLRPYRYHVRPLSESGPDVQLLPSES